MCVSGDKLYVADTENHAIRLVDLTKQTVTTLAGDGVQANSHSKGGDGKSTRLSSPWDLTLVDNKLYIAMAGMHQIWCMDLKSDHIAPYAGNGRENIVDGPLAGASLAQPSGITSDGKKLYFVDSEVSAVREADLSSDGKVRTLVGEGLFDFGDQDGIGNAAKLQHPLGITWHEGKLYIADSYNHKIKVIDPVTRSCQTLIGTGTAGSSLQTLSEPGGLTFLGEFLFIADTNNNQIKKGLNLRLHICGRRQTQRYHRTNTEKRKRQPRR
jgi:DNA-binding beta-propeller fold protein YncE